MLAAYLSSNISWEKKDYEASWVRAIQYNDYYMYENHKVEKFKYRKTYIELEVCYYFKDRQNLYDKTKQLAIKLDEKDKINPQTNEIMEIIFDSLLKNK